LTDTGIEFSKGSFGTPGPALYDNSWSSSIPSLFNGSPPGPVLELPTRIVRLSWNYQTGPVTEPIPIRNAGTGPMNFTAKTDTNWVTCDPSGSVANENMAATFSVTVNPTAAGVGLGTGTYTTTIIVRNGSQSESILVEVAIVQPNVGPFQAVLPNLKNDVVTQIEAERFDLGGQGAGYLDSDNFNDFPYFRTGEGVDIGRISANQYFVTNTQVGEWVGYTVNVADAGNYRAEFRVKSSKAGATLRLYDGINFAAPLTDDLNISKTNSWTTIRANVNLIPGLHVLAVKFTNGRGNVSGDLDWFRLSPQTDTLQGISLTYANYAPMVSVFGATKIEAKNYDRGGFEVAYHDNTVGNLGGSSFRAEEDVDIDTANNLVGQAGGIGQTNEWVNYTVNVIQSGYYNVTLAISNSSPGGQVRVSAGSQSVSLPVPTSSSSTAGKIFLQQGVQPIKIEFFQNASNNIAGYLQSIRLSPADRTLAPTTPTIPSSASTESNSAIHEVGSQFAVEVPGYITALSYYRDANEVGIVHTLRLWNQQGVLLAAAQSNATGPGWKTVTLPSPLYIQPGMYTVSVNTNFFFPRETFITTFPIGATPNVISFVAGCFTINDGLFPNRLLAGYTFTDVSFTPDYWMA
jgi:hypothetical protein